MSISLALLCFEWRIWAPMTPWDQLSPISTICILKIAHIPGQRTQSGRATWLGRPKSLRLPNRGSTMTESLRPSSNPGSWWSPSGGSDKPQAPFSWHMWARARARECLKRATSHETVDQAVFIAVVVLVMLGEFVYQALRRLSRVLKPREDS